MVNWNTFGLIKDKIKTVTPTSLAFPKLWGDSACDPEKAWLGNKTKQTLKYTESDAKAMHERWHESPNCSLLSVNILAANIIYLPSTYGLTSTKKPGAMKETALWVIQPTVFSFLFFCGGEWTFWLLTSPRNDVRLIFWHHFDTTSMYGSLFA